MIDPQRLKRWLIVIAVVYLVFPRDLIPDFLGRGLGYVEDLLLIGVLAYGYRRFVRQYVATVGEDPSSGSHRSGRGRREGHTAGASSGAAASDPYEILSISRSATQKEIRTAYRARMAEYHPDKVAHLGEELQKLATEKAIEIQRAYEQLSA